MHSYRGLVGSKAVLEEFGWNKRKDRGLTGGVIHLFFADFVLAEVSLLSLLFIIKLNIGGIDIGQSVSSAFGESPNNEIRPGGRLRVKNPAQALYSDLPTEEAEYWTSKIIDQSYAAQTTELIRAAYRYISSTYVVCENDQGPPPRYQEMWGKNAGSVMLRINSGHSPMLNKTDELADMIAKAAQGAINHAH
ncbi:hypothetical protein F5Y00DRAFT_237492 [Daldinia vernicosa]|uniref:uncharacterized protein n=1 Tax=Daldinia vernicosa TaxID=114800 RepID=UPI0020075E0C|nr:uncharacterized protein F5Y00DRAFT_237492 [Daldinia vernicosa]KAI0848734.1 hypothetical protein F5Y00DRAFT_237492 [Daldinia vernicosa]